MFFIPLLQKQRNKATAECLHFKFVFHPQVMHLKSFHLNRITCGSKRGDSCHTTAFSVLILICTWSNMLNWTDSVTVLLHNPFSTTFTLLNSKILCNQLSFCIDGRIYINQNECDCQSFLKLYCASILIVFSFARKSVLLIHQIHFCNLHAKHFNM